MMEYKTSMDWLKSLARFGIKPGLERTQRVLHWFSNPQDDLNFYHVAGTNGKGSVCAFLSALLGVTKRVGVFTSPAFDGYRGRFVVNGQPMSASEFEMLASEVRQAVTRVTPDDMLTEFEALTVMAILYFHRQHVDAVVWETGLGGRYDSTNVVMPKVTAITNVSLDHTEILGDTVEKIALDKAGIIKPGVPVITAAKGGAYLVIENVAREKEAPIWSNGTTFFETRENMSGSLQRMSYRGRIYHLRGIEIPLFGAHQCSNAAVALAMYEAACGIGECLVLSDSEIQEAFRNVVWPGRFEVFLHHGLPVVLDGAHNPDGAETLAKALVDFSNANSVPQDGWTMLVGILRDKAILPMLQAMLPLCRQVIVTEPDSPRAKKAQLLANDIQSCRKDVPISVIPSIDEAFSQAVAKQIPLCCWGSLYTVDGARKAMERQATDFSVWGR